MDAQEQKMLEMMQEMLASQAESLRLLTEQIAEKDRINKALEQRVAELSAILGRNRCGNQPAAVSIAGAVPDRGWPSHHFCLPAQF